MHFLATESFFMKRGCKFWQSVYPILGNSPLILNETLLKTPKIDILAFSTSVPTRPINLLQKFEENVFSGTTFEVHNFVFLQNSAIICYGMVYEYSVFISSQDLYINMHAFEVKRSIFGINILIKLCFYEEKKQFL